jgi:GrpB-like predicted nucleotidyltransferase (UPF0157 family)
VRVRVVPPDPTWPAAYAAEAARLAAALGDVVVRLHHVGSTSVPGLAAKPIVDVLLEAADLDTLDARAPALGALGYEALGEFGIPGRRYFRRDDAAGVRTHQVHAFAAGSPQVDRHLAFRDHLIAHPDVARAYGELKAALAARHPDDLGAYMDGKDAFVKHHEALALRTWRR